MGYHPLEGDQHVGLVAAGDTLGQEFAAQDANVRGRDAANGDDTVTEVLQRRVDHVLMPPRPLFVPVFVPVCIGLCGTASTERLTAKSELAFRLKPAHE